MVKMAVVLAVFLYILLQVDDGSAQTTSCVISPDISALTINNGLMRDVELHCQCVDNNGMIIDTTTWFLPDGTEDNTVQNFNIPPAVLVIPQQFNMPPGDTGTYTCSLENMRGASFSDTISLIAGSPSGNHFCTIYSPSLSGAGRVIYIPDGTEDVIIYCICTSNDAAVGPTQWFFYDQAVPTQASGDMSYYRNNVPGPLIIPEFTASDTGLYLCNSSGNPTADTVSLALSGCVISPNFDTLMIRNPLGRDVEFHCQCRDVNGMIINGARWLLSNGTSASTENFNIPYTTLLISQPFNNNSAGTYICSPTAMVDNPARDTVTLNTGMDINEEQTICTIISTNLPSLNTNTGGAIVSGTRNVILYCVCTRNGVGVGSTFWYHNGSAVNLTAANGTDSNPYYRNNVPSPLIIPLFTAENIGRYECTTFSNRDRTTDSIVLTIKAPSVRPPSNIRATVSGAQSIEVTWTVSSSPDVTGYLISYTTDASYIDMRDRIGSMMVSGNGATSGTLSDLEEGTTYKIAVQATANNNVRSGNSNEVTVTTYTAAPSSPPQSVTVTSVNPASLVVTWQSPLEINHNGIITGYVIIITEVQGNDMMNINVNSGTTRARLISELTAYILYSVRIAAVNRNGTGTFSTPIMQQSGQDIPSRPRSLMVMNVTDTTVTLSWMPPDPPNGIITQYQVQYKRNDTSDNFSDNEMNITATNLTYTVTGLMTSTWYRFRVRAFTMVGRGNPSNSVDVFVGLPPPTIIMATVLSTRSIQVTWTLSSSPDVTDYRISYTTTALYTDGGSVIVNSSSATSGTLNNLEEGTTYTITVQATASNNVRSSNSNAMTVTTYTAAPSSPPQSVMIASVNPASLEVTWQPPPPEDHNGRITNYVIQYTRVGSSDMMSINAGIVTLHLISGLVAYVDYSITVAAINVNGSGPISISVEERSGEDRPSEPESLDIIGVNSSSVRLQWSPPLSSNGVIVLYSLKYNSTTVVVTNTSGDMLVYTVGGLSSENVYVFQVTAHTGAGEGPPINLIVVIPPSPVSDVTIPNESVTSSTLTLSWMEVNLTNSVLIHYTVFYLQVSGPYDRIMASNRRKRQLTQPGESTMNFNGTTGTLMGLNGAVIYNIQVAVVVMLGGQVITGDRSAVTNITTPEGVPSASRNLSAVVTRNDVNLTWRRPDPPNGIITQYSVSYTNTDTRDSNTTNIIVVDGGDIVLYLTWTGLSQGVYNFIVVASTMTGPGQAANLRETITFDTGGGSSGSGSGGAVAGGVIGGLLAVAVIIIIIIVVGIYLRRRKGESSFIEKSPKAEKSNVVPLKDITDGKSAGSYEPEIIGLPSELKAIEGQTFSFPSHVTGKPVPDVYWYLNSRDMTEDDTAVISSNGQLTLTIVSIDHAGEWRCQATNSSGSIEAKTRLIVAPGKAKPLPSPRPDRKHKPIPVSEFGTHVKMLHESSNQGFKVEYESFFNGEGMSVAVGSAPNNKPKNRFANIVAYDENRVILGPCGPYKDDYVNASPLDGYKHPRCYIAAQAPVAKTLADFWRLIWQEHPPTIVMVTNLKEGEKVKCVQYWPNSIGETQTYGPLNVSLTEEFEFADYVVRTIELKNTQLGNRLHVVTQYHFTAWPDHGVPDYATAILAFHRRLRGTHLDSIGPLLVHCSAGVGRTGTFITIDMALEQIKAEGVVAIYNIVDKLRHQRPHMVQSQEQYMFIHDAILESITCGNTQVSAADLQRVVTKLKQRDPVTKLTGYEQQYKVLEQVSPRLEDQVSNSALKNPDKNRPYHCHPMEKGRVILRKEKSDYINASFLKGYKQDKAFIVAQSPMQNTVRDFWKMIYDRQCASIVMLCEIMEDGREVCTPYWPQTGAFTYGDMTVTNINTAEAKEFTTRVFKINEKGSSNTRQVTQFHYHSWGAHKAPASPAGLLAVIEEVQRVQRSTGNKPIVVHCSNALGRTGSFCAIFTILDRFKVEQVIDVLQTVKLLRIKRPGIVEDLDQYQFLYTVVVRYLQSFDTYSNFQM